jgi:peptidoglycan/LPS O-acetylase OafA/YrhL
MEPTPLHAMRRLPSLDGLRAVAVLLVCAGHLAGTRHFLTNDQVAHAGDLGNLGVRVFFVISGFLITHLLLAERRRTGRISLKAFYLRRALRIWPAFYVFLACVGLLTAAHVVVNDRSDFMHALTYTMNYRGHTDDFSLRHLWSLSVEEQFYLLWPFLLAMLPLKRAKGVLAGVILVAPVLRVVLYHTLPDYETYAMSGFESVSDALAAGAMLAILMPWLEETGWFDRVLRSRAFPMLFAVVFIANLQTDHPNLFWGACIPVMNVGIALIVARYVRYPDLAFGRLLNVPLAATIGTLSYSLYLWQELFLIQWRTPVSVLQQFPLNITAAIACALLSYYLVEQPFLRLKDRVGAAHPERRRQPEASAVTEPIRLAPEAGA